MSIVKHKDKRNGVTYVYESESYWDKEKKAPRNRRTLIGKIDEETGEIIPTGKRGRKKDSSVSTPSNAPSDNEHSELVALLSEKDKIIASLKKENEKLQKEREEISAKLAAIVKKLSE